MKVSIYIDTDVKGTKSCRGHAWYQITALRNGAEAKVQGEVAFEDHNLHGAVLEALLDALRRIREAVEVEVCTDSRYVASQVNQGNVYLWEDRGYRTRAGEPIRYHDLWQQIIGQIHRVCDRQITVATPLPDARRREMEKTREPA